MFNLSNLCEKLNIHQPYIQNKIKNKKNKLKLKIATF